MSVHLGCLSFIVACAVCGHIEDEHGSCSTCEVDSCDCDFYVYDEYDAQRIHVQNVSSDKISIGEAEVIFGEPAASWPGRCFEVASAIASHVGGVAVYGAWNGPIAPRTVFSKYTVPPNHGWVLLPSGMVLDPTRWVFEGLEPYIYESDNDYYDEGRNEFRKALVDSGHRPFPGADGEVRVLEISVELQELLTKLSGAPGPYTPNQWMWLANTPYDRLGDFAYEFYSVLTEADLKGLIPIDNFLRAAHEVVV